MDALNTVSETALITLKARVLEAEQSDPIIEDDIAKKCLAALQSRLPAETRTRILDRNLPASLTRHIALRARKYDAEARAFIAANPDGLVVSLGCGFDTRYWRVAESPWNYVEIDLPEVVAVKREILGDLISYPLLGYSVLDDQWMAEIRARSQGEILFLAEGLLMYLPTAEVVRLFEKLSETFPNAAILFEVVHERYTRGFWKRGVEAKMKRNLGSGAGSAFQFGLRDAREIETFGPTIKVVEEWSYFEDEAIRPKFLRLFRHFKFVTRTQWTIKAKFCPQICRDQNDVEHRLKNTDYWD